MIDLVAPEPNNRHQTHPGRRNLAHCEWTPLFPETTSKLKRLQKSHHLEFFLNWRHGGKWLSINQEGLGSENSNAATELVRFIFKRVRIIQKNPQGSAHLPAFDVRLPFLQNLQLLHLPLGLVDAGAHGLHHLQGLLHQRVVAVLLGGPFQQLLHVQHAENYRRKKTTYGKCFPQ